MSSTEQAATAALPRQRVILLHGLWMRGFAMQMLGRRLEDAGFEVESFDYPSVAMPLDRAVARLGEKLERSVVPVHLVGHSLGGVIAVKADADGLLGGTGRIVCLGSPLRGSLAARGLGALGGAWLLGASRALLESGIDVADGAREVGVVAGDMALGLGKAFGAFEHTHDGTVALEETRLAGIADHCVVHASHTGLLFSAEAATRTIEFLRDGRFGADAGRAPA